MVAFAVGAVIFFGMHAYSALRTREPVRDIRKRWGEARYMGTYSVLSLAAFALMLWGYGQWASGTALWRAPHSLAHYTWVAMLPVFPLLVAAYAPAGYIRRAVQHPMMWAVLIWAIAHLLVGGDARRTALFGLFAAYAALSLFAGYRRGRVGIENPRILGDVVSVVAGLILFGVFMHGGHAALFGASPFG